MPLHLLVSLASFPLSPHEFPRPFPVWLMHIGPFTHGQWMPEGRETLAAMACQRLAATFADKTRLGQLESLCRAGFCMSNRRAFLLHSCPPLYLCVCATTTCLVGQACVCQMHSFTRLSTIGTAGFPQKCVYAPSLRPLPFPTLFMASPVSKKGQPVVLHVNARF